MLWRVDFMSCMLKFFFFSRDEATIGGCVRPSVRRSVRNQLFFWFARSDFCRVYGLVCPSLICHSVGCVRWLPSWFCAIFIVLLSYCLSFALVCTTVLSTTMLNLVFWFWWFDDLMSFRAIVSCHVCIVCHAIRSMSFIFGRICIYVLVDCIAFRRLRTQVLLACERLLAFCFPPGIVGELASAHGCSVLVLLSTGYCFCVYLMLALAGPCLILRFANIVGCT